MVKVIFLENIEDHKIGDIKDVPDGYARNFLFKKGIAKLATQVEIDEIQSKIKIIEKNEAILVVGVEKTAEKIKNLDLKIKKEVNEEGHLYGSVTNKEISDALSKNKIEVDPANIIIEDHIKELGKFKIQLKLGHGVETELNIEIVRV